MSEMTERVIEITPEMIEAGAEVIWRSFSEVLPWGSTSAHEVVCQVFRAMIQAQGSRVVQPLEDKT